MTIESQAPAGGEAVLADGAATGEGSGTLDVNSISSELVSQHPDFRNLQSTYDKRIAQLQRQLDQSQGHAANAVSQVQEQYGERVRSALGDRLDDTVQRDLQVWEMENRLQAMEQERQQFLEQQARDKHLREISSQYGLDPNDLIEVPDPLAAYQLAADHQSRQVESLKQQLSEVMSKLENHGNAQSHVPDSGGGASVTSANSTQNDYNLAAAHGDTKAMDAIQRHAVANGIELDTGAIYQNPALMQRLKETG